MANTKRNLKSSLGQSKSKSGMRTKTESNSKAKSTSKSHAKLKAGSSAASERKIGKTKTTRDLGLVQTMGSAFSATSINDKIASVLEIEKRAGSVLSKIADTKTQEILGGLFTILGEKLNELVDHLAKPLPKSDETELEAGLRLAAVALHTLTDGDMKKSKDRLS